MIGLTMTSAGRSWHGLRTGTQTAAAVIGLVVAAWAPAAAATSPAEPSIHWQIQPSPNPGRLYNELFSVSALSHGNAWAVGDFTSGKVFQPLAEHWDGVSWAPVISPRFPAGGSFYGVAAVAPCDVWAVGSTLQNGQGAKNALAERWDCNRWSVVPTPPVAASFSVLSRVASNRAGDTWAVGYYEDLHSHLRPLVEHVVSGRWRLVRAPDVGAGAVLFGVAVAGDGSVWAVGAYTDVSSLADRTLIEHWHGGHWDVIPGPNGPGDNVLSAVTLSASSHAAAKVVAVGQWGTSSHPTGGPLIVAWDGVQWRLVHTTLLPKNPGSAAPLSAVATTPGGEVFAAGSVSIPGSPATTAIIEIDGNHTEREASPNRPPSDNQLLGVAAAPDGTAFAVGYSIAAGGRQSTLIEEAG